MHIKDAINMCIPRIMTCMKTLCILMCGDTFRSFNKSGMTMTSLVLLQTGLREFLTLFLLTKCDDDRQS